MSNYYAHQTAIIDEPCQIGQGTKIWHYSHIREGAIIGSNCIIGQNCYIDNGVVIGDNVKIQNGVSVYKGVTIEENVFVGPNVAFTNDKYPSALSEWKITETLVCKGASIGANATIVCGVCIGENSLVGAGSVVCKNVSPNMTVIGNPARAMTKAPPTNGLTSSLKLRIGVIGVGKMGQYHLKTVKNNKQVKLMGFYDTSDEIRLKIKAHYPNIKSYSALNEMFNEVDAVIIASPSPYHYQHVLKALNHDLHVLCEKPLTTDLKTSVHLLTLAQEKDLILQPGQVERFNPVYKALLDKFQSSNLIAIKTSRTGPYSNKHAKTSIIYDLLVHDLDLVIDFLKEDLEVLNVWGRAIHSETIDIADVTLKSSSGILINLFVSRVAEKRTREYRIHALERYIEADLMGKVLKVSVPTMNSDKHKNHYCHIEQQTNTWISGQDQLQCQLVDFLNAIKEKKSIFNYCEIEQVAKILNQIESELKLR